MANSLCVRAYFLLLLVCSAGNSSSEEMHFLLLKTVDEDNHPIKAEIVKWWFSDLPEKKKTLVCKQSTCSEWGIRDKISKPVTIYALASKVKKNDPYCWDWFEGKSENQVDQKEITLTLTYTTTVCK